MAASSILRRAAPPSRGSVNAAHASNERSSGSLSYSGSASLGAGLAFGDPVKSIHDWLERAAPDDIPAIVTVRSYSLTCHDASRSLPTRRQPSADKRGGLHVARRQYALVGASRALACRPQRCGLPDLIDRFSFARARRRGASLFTDRPMLGNNTYEESELLNDFGGWQLSEVHRMVVARQLLSGAPRGSS